ncbi:YtxH domain-containing protein [Pedobacter sp. FW305-3-2-15-E-R2A2]|uniref:YtxH domain-containing protein n=1 Tax=Pedobacter sp. FW305-3-2-15-E-R2A2 TaxID=3140251 RepID=UPI0031403A06
MNENARILLGVFAGMAAGAALGLLLAPEKGSDTRDDLSLSLKDLSHHLQDGAENKIDHLENIKDRLSNAISLRFDQDDYNDHVEHV